MPPDPSPERARTSAFLMALAGIGAAVVERFRAHTHIEVELETGRTHQIRVHLSAIGHPILGDPLYGHDGAFEDGAAGPRRLHLHASGLRFEHPFNGEPLSFHSPCPF